MRCLNSNSGHRYWNLCNKENLRCSETKSEGTKKASRHLTAHCGLRGDLLDTPGLVSRPLATWEAGASATASQSLEPGSGRTEIRSWGAETYGLGLKSAPNEPKIRATPLFPPVELR